MTNTVHLGIVASEGEPPMGMILTLTGRSGSGKTTVARILLELLPSAQMVPSYTTRAARDSDLPNEYRYATPLQTARMKQPEHPGYLWTVQRGHTWYGTAKRSVAAAQDKPAGVGLMILVPDVLSTLRSYAVDRCGKPHSVQHYYLKAPSEDELARRMRGRGDSEESIRERLELDRDWDTKVASLELPMQTLEPSSAGETALAISRLVFMI